MEGTGGYDCPETFSLGKLRFVSANDHGPFARRTTWLKRCFGTFAWLASETLRINSSAKAIHPSLPEKHFLRKHGPNESYAAGPNVEIFETELHEAR